MRRWVRKFLIAALLLFPVIFISLTYLEDIAETATGRQGTEGLIAYLRGLPSRVVDLASEAGYAGIFILMLLEAAAFPVPSEIILPFAGYLVSRGTVDFWPVILYSTGAALIGSFIDYYLGLKLGTPLLTGRTKLPFVDAARLRRAQIWFDRYGAVAVALFRLVPAARVLISFPAGAYRMDKSKFAAYTLVGCLPWNFTLVYLGWWLGTSWGTVVEAFRYINLIAYGFLAFLIVWIGLRFTSKRRLQVR
jgi:membrane protein DedA with SNARE-associated domain